MVLKSKENNVSAGIIRARSVSSRVAKVIRDSKVRRKRLDGGARFAVSKSRKAAAAKHKARNFQLTLKHVTAMVETPNPAKAQGSTTSSTTPQTVTLPNTLPRPQYKEISGESLAKISPGLLDADLEYIRDKLKELGPLLLRNIAAVKATAPTRGPLPKELDILAHDIVPSMMLAVWGPAPDASKTVTLWPAHALVFAVSCSNLPGLPSSYEIPSSSNTPEEPIQLSVPIVPLSLPAPAEFAPLFAFLYHPDPNLLFRTLLPGERVPDNLYHECCNPTNRTAFARHLAETYTVQKLLNHIRTIKGVYQNTVVLGIFHDELWQCLDMAWDVILSSLALATGNMKT